MRASQRVKEKKKEIEHMDRRAELEKQQKRSNLFRERDEKVSVCWL
jgi:hypothetical protein